MKIRESNVKSSLIREREAEIFVYKFKVCFCIQITINNSFKACFSNKKYVISIQTRTTQIENNVFLGLIGFLKIIGVQNHLSFGTVLVCAKILKVKNSSPHTHTNF